MIFMLHVLAVLLSRERLPLDSCRWRDHDVCLSARFHLDNAFSATGNTWSAVSYTSVVWCRRQSTLRWPSSQTKCTRHLLDLSKTGFSRSGSHTSRSTGVWRRPGKWFEAVCMTHTVLNWPCGSLFNKATFWPMNVDRSRASHSMFTTFTSPSWSWRSKENAWGQVCDTRIEGPWRVLAVSVRCPVSPGYLWSSPSCAASLLTWPTTGVPQQRPRKNKCHYTESYTPIPRIFFWCCVPALWLWVCRGISLPTEYHWGGRCVWLSSKILETLECTSDSSHMKWWQSWLVHASME